LRAHGERLRSIYFGGGTPSLLSVKQVGYILSVVSLLFIVDKETEVTMEANPGTINTIYLAAVRALGVNRLSLGVQSMNKSELSLLGRIHTETEARDAVRFARNAGFDNLSLDLMYGLPGQTLQDWRETLDEVLKVELEHLSLYCLSLEANAPIWEEVKRKHLPDIDPDLSADQYELAEDILSAYGYRHYEISNWAKEKRECHHNITYWNNLPYLGVGVAAHSFIDGHRFANTKSVDKYVAAFSDRLEPEMDMDEEISPELQLAETVILGLRLCDGIDLNDIKSRFGIDLLECYSWPVEEMIEAGLLDHSGQHLRLTRRGRLLSNEVFWRFLPDNTDKVNSGLSCIGSNVDR